MDKICCSIWTYIRKFQHIVKKEGAERLPQTIKISRRCTVGVFFKMQSRLLKIKTS